MWLENLKISNHLLTVQNTQNIFLSSLHKACEKFFQLLKAHPPQREIDSQLDSASKRIHEMWIIFTA